MEDLCFAMCSRRCSVSVGKGSCTPLSAEWAKPLNGLSSDTYETVLCVSVSIRDYYDAIFPIPSAAPSLHLQFLRRGSITKRA
jgi:hypothetical protein